ncbi:hypothetical protein KSP35_18700 [Aquihabitans sp. G128]|uniref:hypothetical protein n=1 Tax=Aquihabitans sp. G128 TaxID=2849779 RepID=UPI001C2346F1|nr:hypothetical protein [Aquihabitans sp. G128]QXC60340.1 hypothetical protein KSP35_18700 [Aquihabitans sp. G128]
MSPNPPTRPRRRTATAVALLVLGLGATACGGGSDGDDPGGAASARGVVELHVAASKRYDLAGTCELFTPSKRAEMAAYDDTDAEGYCERATSSVVADADAATKARSRRIYTGAQVTALDRPTGTWFRVEAADGSYGEDVEVVQVDGRWWVAQVESDADDAGDDHGH